MSRAASGGELTCTSFLYVTRKNADDFQMVNMAKFCWAFDITTDAAAVDTNVETAYTNGFLTCPLKFLVQFVPRSPTHKTVIEKEFESVKSFLAKYES